MSEASELPPSESDTVDDVEGELLSPWSRFAAGVTGFTLSGAGATAVFMTDNQAGSVALVLGGVIFLLMLISGNPLRSLGHGDTQMKFATKRRRDRVIDEAREASPSDARRVLDVLSAVDPEASRDASFIQTSAQVYERLVKAELIRLYPECDVLENGMDAGADFRILTPDRRLASIDVKYLDSRSRSAVSATHVRQMIAIASMSVAGHLLVSNRGLTSMAAELISRAQAGGAKVEFVQWRNDQDTGELRQAVNVLLRDNV
ncbi:hypothetical protein [Streptomyces avermitilis]|uniref:hypothetical protein n=1 Tax=Streptomyces avermitilis TaxID=33903 RepID=UPI00381C68EA